MKSPLVLPRESFADTLPLAYTGPIRMGRGSNTLEWLTVQSAVNAAGAVETDLPFAPSATVVRVAHIVAQGGNRGIELRNLGPTFNGHVLRAIVEDNVLRNNTGGEGQGIAFFNRAGVTGATIWATLHRNHAYGNLAGCDGFSADSSGNTILIESNADRFTHNGVGCNVGAGTNSGRDAFVYSNIMMFEAHGDVFEDNDGPHEPVYAHGGGISFSGAGSHSTLPDRISGNHARLVLVDSRFSGNQEADIRGVGGNCECASAGTDNCAEIVLSDISRYATLVTLDSNPPDPTGTNKVVIRRQGKHLS